MLWKNFLKKQINRYYPYLGEGFRNLIADIYWPLMLFFLMINIREIGGLYTLTNGVLAFVTLFIGNITNDSNKHRILNIGVLLHSFSLFIRVLLKNIVTIAIVQSLGALSFSMIRTPFESIHYNKSKKEGIAQTIYAREIYLHIGKIFGFFVLFLSLVIFKNNVTALVITIIFASFATILMSKIKE